MSARVSAGRASTLGAGSRRDTKQEARQRAITELVVEQTSVRIDTLTEIFGVSLVTVHRDLDELEARGLLHKARGVVTAVATTLMESSYQFRLALQRAEKDAVAATVLQMVEPGQSLLLDDSTTGLHLGRLLHERSPLRVITNFQPLLVDLESVRGVSLISTGGTYHSWCGSYLGHVAIRAIRAMHVDTVVMSTSAVLDATCYHQNEDTVAVKRAMLDSADRRILYVDHTKFGRRALHELARLDEFDHVVVDAGLPGEQVQALRARGIDVLVAEVADDRGR